MGGTGTVELVDLGGEAVRHHAGDVFIEAAAGDVADGVDGNAAAGAGP